MPLSGPGDSFTLSTAGSLRADFPASSRPSSFPSLFHFPSCLSISVCPPSGPESLPHFSLISLSLSHLSVSPSVSHSSLPHDPFGGLSPWREFPSPWSASSRCSAPGLILSMRHQTYRPPKRWHSRRLDLRTTRWGGVCLAADDVTCTWRPDWRPRRRGSRCYVFVDGGQPVPPGVNPPLR